MNKVVNIVCLKWGTGYPPVYVNRLYSGVKRHLKRPFRFVCFTNEPEGIVPGVEIQPIPEQPKELSKSHNWPSVYTKLSLFRDGCGGLEGPTLFLDIDQIIYGDMDRFFDYKPGEFCIIHNWIEWRKRIFRKRPNIGNSSCFRFDAGKMNYVWEKFLSNPEFAYDQTKFPTEQAFMTWAVGLENVRWWPDDWVVSFKRACARAFPINLWCVPKPPDHGSILCFHGHPNPHEAIAGWTEKNGNKVPPHLVSRPAQWVQDWWSEDGINTNGSDRS